MPTLCLLCAYYVPPVCFTCFEAQFDGPTMCLLCAHYLFKPIWIEKSMGRQCAHIAPTMRPLCAHYVFHPFWGEFDGPPMRPLCAYSSPTLDLTRLRLDVPVIHPLCVHYAPTMRPRCVSAALGVNRWADHAPTMCRLCAEHACDPRCFQNGPD